MSKSHSLRLFDLTLLGTSGRQEIMITIVFNRMGPVDYMWLIIRCNRNTLVKKKWKHLTYCISISISKCSVYIVTPTPVHGAN